MKKLFISILFAFATFGMAKAIIVETALLKDGSMLYGYMKSQTTEGKIVFATDRAEVTVPSNKANIFGGQAYPIKDLEPAWIEWAEQNDAFEGEGDKRTLMLYSISYNGITANKVRILERGFLTRFIQLTPDTYSLTWDDVKVIKSQKRPKTTLSGIERTYSPYQGQAYTGEFAERTDSTTSLYLKGGEVRTFVSIELSKYTFQGINPNQNIFQQSPLLDVVSQFKGTDIEGIIIEQNYVSSNSKEHYFVILQQDNTPVVVKLDNIRATSRRENPAYAPEVDILLKKDEVRLCDMKLHEVGIKEHGDEIVLDSIDTKLYVPANKLGSTHLTLNYMSENGMVDQFQLVKVSKIEAKKKSQKPIYLFSYKDLVSSAYRPVSTKISINKTATVEYDVDRTGVYVLYDTKNKVALPFVVRSSETTKRK